jgi:prepilin signal peptidase PulO-like enzyme (type II secretory pathway)
MNAPIAMPLPIQLAALALVGLALGCLVNAGIYGLAWFSRPISPWQRPHASAPSRRYRDFIPVVGWLGLRREANLHGRGFWIRPLLLEIACGIGLPALYWWESSGQLAPLLAGVASLSQSVLHQQFVSHAILMALMLVATFIDFDEKTIPDSITIPGTLLGLILAANWPDSHLPVIRPIAPAILGYAPLLLTSTNAWPSWLNEARGLALGVAIFVGWCLALIPALATLRRGWWNGIRFYFASIARESTWWKLLLLAAAGGAAIAGVWRHGGASWQALLTSLVGLAVGGGMIWAVRIGARLALGKEAMGFGDVTLLAMIGTFLGWQACLFIFFLSPFAALVIALAQMIATGRRDIPYGPYLCAAAMIVILKWPWFWRNLHGYFEMGWLLPAILGACLALMVALLMAWHFIERALLGNP